MIDCPICRVKNADDARFCAECGQRLTPSTQPPAQNAPAAAFRSEPAAAPSPSPVRLHSPLLSGGGDMDSASEQSGSVDRLKQLANRQKSEKPTQPPIDMPHKNPFDPRNAQTEEPPLSQGRHRLRSPLLGSDEGDEEESPSSAPAFGPEEDDQAHSGGGLRSPLLGGPYAGPERRQPKAPSDPVFAGNERRRLHSPILGDPQGFEAEADYSAEDEAPIDEDDPNVLRSPLLAARRPVGDKPAAGSPPSATPPPAPPVMPAAAPIAPARPAAVPAAAAPAKPAPVRDANVPGTAPVAGYNFGINEASEPPDAVPPAFQQVQPAAAIKSAKVPPAPVPFTGQKSTPDLSTPGGITVQPPDGKRPVQESTILPADEISSPPVSACQAPKPALLRFVDGSEDAHASPSSSEGMPMRTIVVALIGFLLLLKLWVIVSVLSSEWRNYAFLVVDQVVGLAVLACLLYVCRASKR